MNRCALLLCLLCAAKLTLAQDGITVTNPERAFGYVIGDVLTQRIQWPKGADLKPALDPNTENRVDEYLYRLPGSIQSARGTNTWELRYQIVNAPLQTTSIFLPEVLLLSKFGKKQSIPPWLFNLGPLTAIDDSSDEPQLQTPRANRAALSLLQPPNKTALQLSLTLLVAVLMLWALWTLYRHMRDKQVLPFAHAHNRMKKLPTSDTDNNAESWVVLHHAFNSVSGKVINEHTVSELYSSAPWLKTFSQSIEDFYAASTQRFFLATQNDQDDDHGQKVNVKELCTSLYLAEKREAKLSAARHGALQHG